MVYFIFEYINAKYSSLESFDVTLFFIWLEIPKYFTRDLPISSIWLFHVNVSSSVTPRYLKKGTLSLLINSVWILRKFIGIGLFTVWNNTKFVLSLFMISLFLTHHIYKWGNFSLISSTKVVKFLCHKKEQYRQQRAAHDPSLQIHKYHLYTGQKTTALKQNPEVLQMWQHSTPI